MKWYLVTPLISENIELYRITGITFLKKSGFQGGGSDVVSVSCFGVRVSVMFHFMFVHYTFSSVWVAEWPPLGNSCPLG